MTYPFVPGSTNELEPGHFWSIPLANGSFACGRVLQMEVVNGQRARKRFLAGLLDWHSSNKPDYDSIAGSQVIAHGEVHIKTIQENGGEVLGLRPLSLDHIEIPFTLAQSPGSGCRLRQGFQLLGIATLEQQTKLPVFSTWGYGVIKTRAEKQFGKKA